MESVRDAGTEFEGALAGSSRQRGFGGCSVARIWTDAEVSQIVHQCDAHLCGEMGLFCLCMLCMRVRFLWPP